MNKVFEVIRGIWKTKELRNKILFILAMLFIFRLAAHVPLPGVDLASLRKFFESNQLFGLLNVFSGGSLDQFSIVMLGVAPYITASIILQLLQMIVPSLEALAKEGEAGQRKINMYTRWLSVPLAVIQGYGFITLIRRSSPDVLPNLGIFDFTIILLMVTAGTMLLIWIGELMTEKKLGNGVSLLIFAGILADLPSTFAQTAATLESTQVFNTILFIAIALITVVGVVFITEGQRQVPVSFARRIRGMKQYGGVDTYLPLRVNLGGVIPIIFAVSIVVMPQLVAQFFLKSPNEWLAGAASFINKIFNTGGAFYLIFYFLLVFVFTYFYTAVIFHPHQIAENLQKQGGFIPGIRPGHQTAEYLNYTINRIILAGAVFLGVIAILPYVTQNLFGNGGLGSLAIGGTSLLIAVSVALEVKEQVKAQMAMRSYESY
ncbi:MAG TPA: preprotein translocase subunit SecY [Patescibacteria group bacterium]|nr:preprotein translocase subunit SecY [Patescibacteria group bacterium]HLD62100.1 preprotein translocase subunit SecY [Patescibacteria group bacterium]